jgi:hypothetical protein
MEALLDPGSSLESFDDYGQFERHARAWKADTEKRAALAAVAGCIRELRHRLLVPLEMEAGMPSRGGIFPLEAALLEARSAHGEVQDSPVAHDSLRWAIGHCRQTAWRATVRQARRVLKWLRP